MKNAISSTYAVCLLTAFAGATCAATYAQDLGRSKDPEADWATLTGLVYAPPSSGSATQGKKTKADRAAEATAKVENARQAALAAKQFYTAHPTHVYAGQARKLEALAALRGVADDTAYEETARQIARAYRGDRAHAVNDRFEVAVLAERTESRAKFGGNVFANNGPELVLVADRLRTEFGDIPEVFNFYAGVARAADMNTARQIAANLQQWPASASAKAEAEELLARHRMLNQPLDLKLKTSEAQVVDFTQLAGKVTLLFVWPASSPGSLALLSRVKNLLPTDAQVIYYSPMASVAEVNEAKKGAVIPGVFSGEATDGGDVLSQRLRTRHLPFAFAFGRDGKLAGYGPVDALGSVVNAATR